MKTLKDLNTANAEFWRGPAKDAGFEESKHPRSASGQFGSGGGGTKKAAPKPTAPGSGTKHMQAKKEANEGTPVSEEGRRPQDVGKEGRAFKSLSKADAYHRQLKAAGHDPGSIGRTVGPGGVYNVYHHKKN